MGCANSMRKKRSYYDEIVENIPKGHGYIRPLVLVGPSGSGKKILYKHLKAHYSDQIVKAVSVTTRPRLAEEIDGVDYIFESAAEFKKQHDAGKFFEHSEFNGN